MSSIDHTGPRWGLVPQKLKIGPMSSSMSTTPGSTSHTVFSHRARRAGIRVAIASSYQSGCPPVAVVVPPPVPSGRVQLQPPTHPPGVGSHTSRGAPHHTMVTGTSLAVR